MIRELDTRTIFGNGGRVVWGFDGEARHHVSVLDNESNVVAVLTELSPAEAALAFWHTFADPRVPDIFRREPETLLAESQEDEDDDDVTLTPFDRLWNDINRA